MSIRDRGGGAAPHAHHNHSFEVEDPALSQRLAKKKEELRDTRRRLGEKAQECKELRSTIRDLARKVRMALSAIEGSLLLPDDCTVEDVLEDALARAEDRHE